jgi:hypothetical protein
LVFIHGTAANAPYVVKQEMLSMILQQIAGNVPGAGKSLMMTAMTGRMIAINVQDAERHVKTSTPGSTIARNAQNAARSAEICIS